MCRSEKLQRIRWCIIWLGFKGSFKEFAWSILFYCCSVCSPKTWTFTILDILKLQLFFLSSPFQEQHKNLQASKDHLSLTLQDHKNALVAAQVLHSHDYCFKLARVWMYLCLYHTWSISHSATATPLTNTKTNRQIKNNWLHLLNKYSKRVILLNIITVFNLLIYYNSVIYFQDSLMNRKSFC